MKTVRFRAMGSEVYLGVLGGHDGLLADAERRVHDLERKWSRFLPSSEICGLNAAHGREMAVSPETVQLVGAACDAWAFTGGRFDPTVHDSLVQLGYDRHIADVQGGLAAALAVAPAMGCHGIEIDEAAGTVRLPLGVRLDPGGIGKGLAADLVATELCAGGAAGAMASVGGDVRVTGCSPDHSGWAVGIEHPTLLQRSLGTVQLYDGAVATSSRLGRRWHRHDGPVHHLLDPRGGACTSGVTAVSVVAATAAWADALTKVCCIDPDSCEQWLGRATAVVVRDDGRVHLAGQPLPGLRLAAA